MKKLFGVMVLLLVVSSCSLIVDFEDNSDAAISNNTTNNTVNNSTNNITNINGEVCFNHVDDENDTMMDCEDPECASVAFCNTSDSCSMDSVNDEWSSCDYIDCRFNSSCDECTIGNSYWNTDPSFSCSQGTCTFLSNASVGCGVNSGTHYSRCNSDTECPKGSYCNDNSCVTVCSQDNTYCPRPDDTASSLCMVFKSALYESHNLGYCILNVTCSPLNSGESDCPESMVCRPEIDFDNPGTGDFQTYCSPYRGTSNAGGDCSTVEDCREGSICLPALGKCASLCRLGELGNCGDNEICNVIMSGNTVGVCIEMGTGGE
ncbi:MAG: hypothetical protein JXR95_16415 [Deltaproteobacteria bacterium]|nr:hypothetical protein [Deltaproteobacteria bacterium]